MGIRTKRLDYYKYKQLIDSIIQGKSCFLEPSFRRQLLDIEDVILKSYHDLALKVLSVGVRFASTDIVKKALACHVDTNKKFLLVDQNLERSLLEIVIDNVENIADRRLNRFSFISSIKLSEIFKNIQSEIDYDVMRRLMEACLFKLSSEYFNPIMENNFFDTSVLINSPINPESQYRCTILHLYACNPDVFHNIDLLRMMERAVDPNQKDSRSNTPLHIAADFNHLGAVFTLLSVSGTRVHERNGVNMTPVHIAYHKRYLDVFYVLLSHSTIFAFMEGWPSDALGRYILYISSEQPEVFKYLLENKISSNRDLNDFKEQFAAVL